MVFKNRICLTDFKLRNTLREIHSKMWYSLGFNTWVTFVSNIYINDLCNITHYASPTATTRMYADDTNLTYSVCSISELQKSM